MATAETTWMRVGQHHWYAITFAPGLHGGVDWDPAMGTWCWYVYLGDDLHAEGRADTRSGAQEAAEGSAEEVVCGGSDRG